MIVMPHYTRRQAIEAAAAAGLLPASARAAAFPTSQPERALYPCPPDGAQVGVNPPGFAWWLAPGAATYRLTVRDSAGKPVYQADALREPVHLPARTLAPGRYRWDVEACGDSGAVLARRGEWIFDVPNGLPELPWEDPRKILARVPPEHPRYVFLKADLPRLRATLGTTRRAAWEQVKQAAGRALKLPLPERPAYHTFEGRARQRMGYKVYFREFRRRVDAALSPLSLAWLLTGDERYGERAKKLLLEIGSWTVEGPMSLLSPFGDEPGLTMARHGQRAYDWLYPLFSASEREQARAMTVARGRQILERLRKARYLATPAESHNGRLIAYLSEYAIVLRDEAPDSAEWLDYSLRALTTFYPHWGDSDGGWAEGISYALAYNTIYLGAIESLRAAAGFDLYKRPFFRNARRFFLYCASPVGEMKPFGDGTERGVGVGGALLLTHHARRFNDPHSMWWAGQTGHAASDALISMVTEDTVKPAPPSSLPSAAVFRGIGWAALHSALDRPQEDTFFLFKSSPFGSVSHSHADQNSFAILKGGSALAIPSGYYGPAYGMPHHAEWTRQTKANNCILVNGEGQVVRDSRAQGRIAAFRHQKALTYVCGDAAQAYQGKLTRFLRHVLFLRPGVFVLLDEVAAPQPAGFSWLLHAFDKMETDSAAGTVKSVRAGASLLVRLACGAGLAFSQTDVFDTPYNEGNPPEYHEKVENQWHFTARTKQRAREARIAAAMVVSGPAEAPAAEWRERPGWLGIALKTRDGEGEAWVETTPGSEPPGFVSGKAVAAGRWRPVSGPEEMLVV